MLTCSSREVPGCEEVANCVDDALAIGPGHRHHAALGMVARNDCMIAVTASGASWVTR